MLKKGHEFGQKKKRQKVKRKQRRKDVEHDHLLIKHGVGVRGKSRKGFGAAKKVTPKAPRKKKKKATDARIELTDANMKQVMSRYALINVDEDRPLAVGQPPEVIAQIEKMMAEGKNVYEIFKELGIPLHTHSKE